MYVRDLTRRTYRKEVLIRGPEDVFRLCRTLRRRKKEFFAAVLVDSRNSVIGVETISIGSLNASIVHPRETFLPALENRAGNIILVHNHPSGDPTPSEEDLAITRRLVEAGKILGIEVLDHVVVAGDSFVSFKERRLLRSEGAP